MFSCVIFPGVMLEKEIRRKIIKKLWTFIVLPTIINAEKTAKVSFLFWERVAKHKMPG